VRELNSRQGLVMIFDIKILDAEQHDQQLLMQQCKSGLREPLNP
jgi:hypothetical protein